MKPCGPAFTGPARPAATETAMPVKIKHDERHHERAEAGEFDLGRLDLFTEVLRCSPDHQAADEHGDDGVDEDRVEPTPRTARRHLAEHHPGEQAEAADRGERVVGGVGRSGRGHRRGHAEQRRRGVAEADLFALHVAGRLARDAGRGDRGVALVLGVAREARPSVPKSSSIATRSAAPCRTLCTILPKV